MGCVAAPGAFERDGRRVDADDAAAGQAPIGSLDPRLQQEPLSSERCPDSR